MRKILIIFILFFASITSYAASESGGVPYGFIKLQTLNFIVFFGIVVVLVKFKVNPILKQMKQDYLEKANEAQRKLEEAKKERDELKAKLEEIQGSHELSLKNAREQAEAKKEEQIQKAKESADAMTRDLEHQVTVMRQSYAYQLKEELVSASIEELKKDLETDFDEASFQQLQKSFVNRMDVRL